MGVKDSIFMVGKITDPFDPQINIDGGVRYLKELLGTLNSFHPETILIRMEH